MTIPASVYVNINPSVINGGGNALYLNGVILTKNLNLPSNSVVSFSSSDAVSLYFGLQSAEYSAAAIYFKGINNTTQLPGELYFAPYHDTAVPAFVRGGSLAGELLSDIQAISGSLSVTIDGVEFTTSSLNLSTATSFSNAGTLITSSLSLTGGSVCIWNALTSTFQINSGTSGVDSTITYCEGTASSDLRLSSNDGAILSQGADADTPLSAMNKIINNTTNWATFTTLFEPSDDDKLEFASWNNLENKKYMYVLWDSGSAGTIANNPLSIGYKVFTTYKYDGTTCIGGDPAFASSLGVPLSTLVSNVAYFILSYAACINFSQTNGRLNAAFKSQSGILPTCGNAQIRSNLLTNGYSIYAQAGAPNQDYDFFDDGSLSGQFRWMDSYLNQIYMNSQFQLFLLNFLTRVNSLPYNQDGYSQLTLVLNTPIQEALNTGIIRTGVSISSDQTAVLIGQAGFDISSVLFSQGYYLQILDPGAQIRVQRKSPIINFWYCDGQSIQYINMNSINIL